MGRSEWIRCFRCLSLNHACGMIGYSNHMPLLLLIIYIYYILAVILVQGEPRNGLSQDVLARSEPFNFNSKTTMRPSPPPLLYGGLEMLDLDLQDPILALPTNETTQTSFKIPFALDRYMI